MLDRQERDEFEARVERARSILRTLNNCTKAAASARSSFPVVARRDGSGVRDWMRDVSNALAKAGTVGSRTLVYRLVPQKRSQACSWVSVAIKVNDYTKTYSIPSSTPRELEEFIFPVALNDFLGAMDRWHIPDHYMDSADTRDYPRLHACAAAENGERCAAPAA